MKPTQSIIQSPFRRTAINLYFRHTKMREGRPVLSIRSNAFVVSLTIPKFSPYNVNYTRPSNYY